MKGKSGDLTFTDFQLIPMQSLLPNLMGEIRGEIKYFSHHSSCSLFVYINIKPPLEKGVHSTLQWTMYAFL